MIAPSLDAYLVVSAAMFVAGVLCMISKRNAIGVLMGVELILTAANINLIAFARYGRIGLDGHLFALFVIVLAAGEAAIALAIALNFYNNFETIDVDRASNLKG
jgi:NADH-quinone oxidoreductase subunit K